MSYVVDTANDYVLSSMGAKGCTLIKDTVLHTGKWRSITVLQAAAFTTLTSDCKLNAGGTGATGADYGTVPVGNYPLPNITAIQLTSGAVLAYV